MHSLSFLYWIYRVIIQIHWIPLCADSDLKADLLHLIFQILTTVFKQNIQI